MQVTRECLEKLIFHAVPSQTSSSCLPIYNHDTFYDLFLKDDDVILRGKEFSPNATYWLLAFAYLITFIRKMSSQTI